MTSWQAPLIAEYDINLEVKLDENDLPSFLATCSCGWSSGPDPLMLHLLALGAHLAGQDRIHRHTPQPK